MIPIEINIIPVAKNNGIEFFIVNTGVHASNIYYLNAYLNASFLSIKTYYSYIRLLSIKFNKTNINYGYKFRSI